MMGLAMNGGAKCRRWVVWVDGYRSLKVIDNVTIGAYDFLFNFNRNYAAILRLFRDIAIYFAKVADFNLPHLHFAPPAGGESGGISLRFLTSGN